MASARCFPEMTTPDPAYPSTQLPVGTVTFLFTDIEGSTNLWERQREAMRSALARHDGLMRQYIGEHNGCVIKTTGDGFHAAFASAPDALEAALAAQQAFHAESWPEAVRIRVRMGLHTGAAELREGDYYGPAVNRAARLAALGHGGQTLLSEVTHNLCRDLVPPDVTFRPLGEHTLKGLVRREAVFELCHPALPQTFPPLQLIAPIDENTPSIAVLPFADLSPQKDQEYFTDGLTEELLNVLAKIGGLRVASRTSAFSFKGRNVDIPTVAQKLNVATILEGSVRKSGNRVRITAQLIHAATDSHLWSETYDRELEDIFAVQDDISQAVVKELRAALLGTRHDWSSSAQVKADVEAATKGRAGDADAYPLYLQGRFFADRQTKEDTAKAIDYYRKAVALDPKYALAWAWIGRAYADQGAYAWAPHAEAFEQARHAAELALELEPNLAEGHATLGFIRMVNDRNWEGAHASFRRALELAPGSAHVLRGAAILAACRGGHEEAVSLLRRAVTLDPLSVPAHRVLASRCLYAGLLEEAESSLARAIELNPSGGLTQYWLGMVHLARSRLEQARAAFEQERNAVLRLLGVTLVEHTLGHTAEAQTALKELVEEHAIDGPFQIALAYAYLGDADKTFEWLERADVQRDPGLIEIKAETLLRNVYTDPRWPVFLRKMGFS
jgi:TolB-like protein/class 3 adenylate cyclase/Flp pilus assembly protein TadD